MNIKNIEIKIFKNLNFKYLNNISKITLNGPAAIKINLTLKPFFFKKFNS